MPSTRRSAVVVATLSAAALTLVPLPADAVPSEQVFASFESTSSGQLQDAPFTVQGCEVVTVGTSDLSGADFAPAGATDQVTASCTTSSGFTVVFDEPVADLDLYLVGLPVQRCKGASYTVTTGGSGPFATAADTERLVAADPGTLTIASGFEGGTVEGATLNLPLDGDTSGVLHVAGPVSDLVLTSDLVDANVTFTLGTAFVAPTTTTSAAPTSTADEAVDNAEDGSVAGAGAAVAPRFAC